MARAKITLSPTERQLVTDAGWILTKNAVIEKVYRLFGELSEAYDVLLAEYGAAAITGPRSPKISRGEQYEGLPWVMLDHPRNFSVTDTLAIRSFFWWGNFCSITLQLSGTYRQLYENKIAAFITASPGDWLVYTGTDAWEHHLRGDVYVPAASVGQSLKQLPFLKLAKKISLEEWDNIPAFFTGNYSAILSMLLA